MFAHGAFQSQNAQQQPATEKLHNTTQHTVCVAGELLVALDRLLLIAANIQLCFYADDGVLCPANKNGGDAFLNTWYIISAFYLHYKW